MGVFSKWEEISLPVRVKCSAHLNTQPSETIFPGKGCRSRPLLLEFPPLRLEFWKSLCVSSQGSKDPRFTGPGSESAQQSSEGPRCGIRLSALQSNYLVPLLKLPHLKMGIFKKQYPRHGFSKLNEVPHIERRALCWAYHHRPTRTWDVCREGGGLQESAGTFICFMPRNSLNFCN